mgnify:CR=1 FL=1
MLVERIIQRITARHRLPCPSFSAPPKSPAQSPQGPALPCLSRQDDKLYVKVIDYKSGNRRFDLAALYYGLQLQLVVYMNAAVELVI